MSRSVPHRGANGRPPDPEAKTENIGTRRGTDKKMFGPLRFFDAFIDGGYVRMVLKSELPVLSKSTI